MATKTNRTCLARLPSGELQELSAAEFDQIDGLRKKRDHVIWLDIASPTADDLDLLRDEFSVHPLALGDLRKRRQRPKLDKYAEQEIIVTYEVLEPSEPDKHFELGEIHLFAGPGYLVSVRWHGSPAIEEVEGRFRERPDGLARPPGSLISSTPDSA